MGGRSRGKPTSGNSRRRLPKPASSARLPSAGNAARSSSSRKPAAGRSCAMCCWRSPPQKRVQTCAGRSGSSSQDRRPELALNLSRTRPSPAAPGRGATLSRYHRMLESAEPNRPSLRAVVPFRALRASPVLLQFPRRVRKTPIQALPIGLADCKTPDKWDGCRPLHVPSADLARRNALWRNPNVAQDELRRRSAPAKRASITSERQFCRPAARFGRVETRF